MSTRELRAHERETKKTEQSSRSKKNRSVNKSAVTSPSKNITSSRKAAKSSRDLETPQKSDSVEENKAKKRRRDGKPTDNELPKGQFQKDEKSKETQVEVRGAKKRGNKRENATAATETKKPEPKRTPVDVTKIKRRGANKKIKITADYAEVNEAALEVVNKRRFLRTRPSTAVNIKTVAKARNKSIGLEKNTNKSTSSGTSGPKTGEVSDTGVDEQENATVADSKDEDELLEIAEKSKANEVPLASRSKKQRKKQEYTAAVNAKVDEIGSADSQRRLSLRTKTVPTKAENVTKTRNKNNGLEKNTYKSTSSGTSEPKTGEVSGTRVDKQENATVADLKVDELLETAERSQANEVPLASRSKKQRQKQEYTTALNAKVDEIGSVVSQRRQSLRTKIVPTKAETVTKVGRRNKRAITQTIEVVDSGSIEPETSEILNSQKAVDVNTNPVVNDGCRNKQDLEESSALTELGTITVRRPQKKVESHTKVESELLQASSQIDSDGSVLPLDTSVPANIPDAAKVIKSVEHTERSKAPSLPRKLRHKALQDYAESSLESSRTENGKPEVAQQTNVPIYKRKVEEVPVHGKKKGGEADLYEFDSDVEDGAARKKKKRKLNDSYYDEYNKTISNIMQNVMKKVRNRKAKKDGTREVKIPEPKQKSLKHNAESKRNVEVKPKVIRNNGKLLQPKTKNNTIRNHKDLMHNVTVQLVPLKLDAIKDQIDVLHAGTKLDLNKNKEMLAVESDSDDHSDHNVDNHSLDNYADEDFDEFLPPFVGSDRVQILSNILLNASKSAVSPWRFNQRNVTRNPHFITLKRSALPAVNQEMVLDHTMVDKFDELSRTRCEKTPPNSTIPKQSAVVQTTVTDFFKSSNNAQLKENPRLSLFDCEDFSPIKNPVGNNAALSVETRSSVVRKILTENVNPNQMASTPIRDAGARNPETIDISAVRKPVDKGAEDIESCFGFDSDEEQNESSATPKAARKSAKPFRLSGKVVMKRYERKEKPKTVPEVSEQVAKKLAVEETTEKATEDDYYESDSEESEIQSSIPEVGGIFQDLSNAEKDLKPKEPKQKKLKWLIEDDDDILKFKKKRKDCRTKEEEAAAEKWAADFNSMCEEIDQFPLEIE